MSEKTTWTGLPVDTTGTDENAAKWVVAPSPLNANRLVAFRRDGSPTPAEEFRRIMVRVAPDFTVYGKPDTVRSRVVLTPVGKTGCGVAKAEEIARRLNAPTGPWTIVARGGELLASYGENTPLSWLTASMVRHAIRTVASDEDWSVEPHTDHDEDTCGTPQAKCRSTVRVSCRSIELDSNDTTWVGEALVNVVVEAPWSVSPCTVPRRKDEATAPTPTTVAVDESAELLARSSAVEARMVAAGIELQELKQQADAVVARLEALDRADERPDRVRARVLGEVMDALLDAGEYSAMSVVRELRTDGTTL